MTPTRGQRSRQALHHLTCGEKQHQRTKRDDDAKVCWKEVKTLLDRKPSPSFSLSKLQARLEN